MTDGRDDPFGLQPIWSATLDVYQAFAAVCDKYGLRHTLAYGTLLGAVRHGGFIPWDDDFDVHMPREDYERFRSVAYKDLAPFCKFVTSNNTPSYPAFYGKIQDVRPEVVERVERTSGQKRPHGVYIDVFPVDDVPVSWQGRLRLLFLGKLLSQAYYHYFNPCRLTGFKGRLHRLIGGTVTLLFPRIRTKRDYIAYFERLLGSVRSEGDDGMCGRYLEFSGRYAWKTPKSSFRNLAEVEFCGRNMPAMSGYDSYLRQNFGDYMKLPAAGKRMPSHADISLADWRLGPTTDLVP